MNFIVAGVYDERPLAHVAIPRPRTMGACSLGGEEVSNPNYRVRNSKVRLGPRTNLTPSRKRGSA